MAITTIADTNYLNDVYNSSPLPYPQINIPISLDAGCTMEIQNYSPFVLQIYNGKTLAESLPPYSWLICSYIDKATANIVSPASLPFATGAFITTNVIPQTMTRQRGDFTLPLAQTVNTPVITPTGSTLAVAGSLNVANVVSATITQASGTTLAISSVGSITENVTTSANIVNESITTNGIVQSNAATLTITNLASGDTTVFYDALGFPNGWYDGLTLLGYCSSTTASYTISIVPNFGMPNPPGGILQPDVYPTNNFTITNTPVPQEPVVTFDTYLINRADVYVTNTTSGTIASDTINLMAFLMPQGVVVENSGMSPAQMQTSYQMTQTALGTYNLSGTSFTGIIDLQTTPTFATDNLKTMHVMISVTNASGLSSTCTVDIKLESAMSSGGMLYDVGSTNTYPTVFSISGTANVSWDNAVTPQMSSAYPYLAFEVYLNNTSGTATTASATVAITVMVNS